MIPLDRDEMKRKLILKYGKKLQSKNKNSNVD